RQAGRAGRNLETALEHIEVCLGYGEIEVDDRGIVQRRDDRSGVDETADAHATKARAPIETRADHRIVEARLCRADPRAVGLERRLDRVELRDRKGLLREEVLPPPELILAIGQRRLRFLELRSCLGAVELDQHVSLAHEIALFETDRDDRVRRLRGYVDGFAGARRTDRFDLDAERTHHGDGRDDRDAGGLSGYAAGLIHRSGTCRKRQKGTENEDSERGTGTACRVDHPRMLARLGVKRSTERPRTRFLTRKKGLTGPDGRRRRMRIEGGLNA